MMFFERIPGITSANADYTPGSDDSGSDGILSGDDVMAVLGAMDYSTLVFIHALPDCTYRDGHFMSAEYNSNDL